jgi:predicted ATPase/DNA-binding SARP family transcriptional activator
MRVAVLGNLEVWKDDGSPIEVPGGRLRSLLTWLAVDAGHRIGVEELFDLLWADEPPAPNALQSLVSRLRRVLDSPELLESVAGGYRLRLDRDLVDAHRFEALAGRGHSELAAGHVRSAATTLREALAMWRGAALADVAGSPYAAATIARLDALRLSALEDRLTADIALGQHASALVDLEELCEAEPLRERLRGLQMRALYAAGRQADALGVYEQIRTRLADDLGTDPTAELQELHLAILRADPRVLSNEAAEVLPGRHNLPAPLTTFIGRDEELALVGKRLEESRLVTLVGPGGSGKTRLAIEVGHRMTDRSPDGVWLVELAPVTNPDDIAQVVIDSLRLRENRMMDHTVTSTRTPPADARSRLIEGLSDQRVLIVLDNCEHLVRAAAELAEQVLTRCPGISVLATSREPLAISGESLCAVPPLGLPPSDVSAVNAVGYPAVALFLGRAAAAKADFDMTDDTLAPILEICRRLDGLPLAIELAAARMRTMTVSQVSARLGDRFRLLTGGSRTALPRQQTLRAVVAWSWDLLDDTERIIAEKFGIFPGGASAHSVAEICGLDDIDVEDVLTALAEKSLVESTDGDERRYRMLETIREFGVERLTESGEIMALRRAHARYFLQLAEQAEPFMRRAEQAEWIRILTVERDNLLAAMRFTVDDGDADTAIRMGAALAWYWTLRGTHAEAATWLGTALDVPGGAPAEKRAIVQGAWALSQVAANGPEPVNERLTAVMAELRQAVDELDVRNGHPLLALLAPIMSVMLDNDRAKSEAVIAGHLDHPDQWVRSALTLTRAMVHENEGVVDPDRTDLLESLAGFRSVGDRWGAATALQALGSADAADGNLRQALAELSEAGAMLEELDAGDDFGHMYVLSAAIRAQHGDADGARRDLDLILERARQTGSRHAMAEVHAVLSAVERQGGNLDAARREIGLAREHSKLAAFQPPQMASMIETGASMIEIAAGKLDRASTHLRTALQLAEDSRDMPVVSHAVIALAEFTKLTGDAVNAAKLLGISRNLRGTLDKSNPDLTRIDAALRAEIGAEMFEAAYDEGLGLERAETLAFLQQSRPTSAS